MFYLIIIAFYFKAIHTSIKLVRKNCSIIYLLVIDILNDIKCDNEIVSFAFNLLL